MRTSGVSAGDIVELDVRGLRAFARVVDTDPTKWRASDPHKLEVEPLKENGHLPARLVTARQVVGHYRKAKGSR